MILYWSLNINAVKTQDRNPKAMYPENYHQMDIDEKLGHWAKVLDRDMRWAGEDGGERSQYSIES